MSTLSDYQDLFDPNNYPPNDDGLSIVPNTDIYDMMRAQFGNGYSWTPFAVGFNPDGGPYFVGILHVRDGDFEHIIPGTASLPAGFDLAGAETAAFKRAVLRGLGMGDALYKNRPEDHETSASKVQDRSPQPRVATGQNNPPSVHSRGNNPPCPSCGRSDTVIRGKAEYGGGFVCWKKQGGCGANFTDGPSPAAAQTVSRSPFARR